jgi:hypothetical protein
MVFNKNTAMTVANSLYRSYFIIVYFLLSVYKRFFPNEPITVIVIDPVEKYKDSQKYRFIKSIFTPFDNAESNTDLSLKNREKVVDLNMKRCNENVDEVFYSKSDYTALLSNVDNYLEKKWKSNILFESTPRGNIIMYYDVFKQGFAYYSDMSSIAYDIINAVAMKYVCVFRCTDFFIDQNVTPEDKNSPFIKLHFTEEKPSSESKKEINPFEGAPFAKFKNYNNVENKGDKNTNMQKIRNKFIHLGKISNFSILQRVVKKNKLNGFQSTFSETLSGETDLQKQVLDYKKYKQSKLNQ